MFPLSPDRPQDNVSEVLKKWDHIDDEIWGKLIFMSRNRRVAKAYVRLPAVIVDGSDEGFDGHRVGINGFDDPFRDAQTDKLMRFIDKVGWARPSSSSSLPLAAAKFN